MPIDPSIPLAVTQPKFNTPFEAMGQAMQLRQQQQEQQANQLRIQEAQRQAAEQDTYRKIIGNPDLTPENFLEQVRVQAPGQYEAAKARYDAHQVNALQVKELKQKVAAGTQQWIGGMLQDIVKSNYNPTLAELTLKSIEQEEPDFKPKADAIRQQILQGGPQALKSVVDQMLPAAGVKTEKLGPEDRLVNQGTGEEIARGIGKTEKPPNVGSFEDYVTRVAKAAGKTPEMLSPRDVTKARADFEASGRAPQEPDVAPSLSPEGLNLTAHQYAMTGQLPPMGMGKQGAAVRTAIINKAADIYKGLDLPTQVAAYKANQQSLTKLQGQRDAMGAFEQTALKNLDQFLDTAGKVVDTGSPLVNKPLRSLSGALMGSPEMTAYNVARRTVIPEFAKILANPGLSGQLSDSARKEIEQVVSGDATLKQTLSAAKILKTDAANRRTSYDSQIKEIQDRIGTPPGGAKASSGTIRARDPQGVLHEAPAGTPLPAGWKAES